MDTETFWNMLADGRLAALARDNPLDFDILCEAVIEAVIQDGGPHSESLQIFSDTLTLKLLWDVPTFDEQSVLSQKHPALFERRRERIINAHTRLLGDCELIAKANRLQWRVDQERKKHASALGACVALNRMMQESMWGENGLRDALNRLFVEPSTSETESESQQLAHADVVVLPFTPRSK